MNPSPLLYQKSCVSSGLPTDSIRQRSPVFCPEWLAHWSMALDIYLRVLVLYLGEVNLSLRLTSVKMKTFVYQMT